MSENRPTAPLGPPDKSDETPRVTPQVQRLQRLDEPVLSEGPGGARVEGPLPEAEKKTVEVTVPLVPAPPPEDGPTIPSMTPEALAETLSKSSAELAMSSSGERRPFAVPPTRVYDTSITKRLENDPELGRPVREPVLETPARPLPRPVATRPTMRDRIRYTTVRVIDRVPNRYRPDLAKLRRRTIYVLLALLALRLVVALVLNFTLDLVCRELLGLSVDVGHSHLRLASGEVVFEDLALSTPGGQPIARVGRAELEISWSALPTIWIHRAVLEDATITLRREVDGSMPALAELLELIQKEIAKPPKPNKTPPRVVLDAVRVNHGRVAWEDVSTVPPLKETLELEARADDLALDGRRLENPTRVSVRLQAPGLLDALRLDAAARPEGDARALDLDFALEGHPRILSAYLAPHVVPIARSVSLEAKARLVTRPCLLEGQEGQTADLAVERLAYKADDDEVGCDRLLVSARRVARDALEVSSVVVDRPRAALAKLRRGGVRFGGFEFPSHEDAPEEKRAPTKPFELPFMLVDEVAVHAGSFHFTDETTAPTVSILARELEASLRDVVKDPRRPQAKARLDVSVAVDDLARRIQVAGTVAPFGEPRTASLTAGARGISLAALEPWLAQAGLGTALSEGTLSLGVEASLAEKNGRYVLDATASRVTLDETQGDRRAAIDAVKVTRAELDPDTGSLAVGAIEVTGPQARLVRSKDGVEFVGLRTRSRVPSLVPESEQRPRKTPLIRRVSVEKVLVSDVKATWRDDTAATPIDLGLSNGRVAATGISFVVSSTEVPKTPACLTASFDVTPAFGTVRLDAALVANPAAPSVSGTLACSHVSLAPLAPYLARAGMEPALEDGLVTARV
ncbi:MAG TPA: DUF748 domain-containing protein, partial [Planctomycetota bacterium]|nr:DUF748 domain-containing protein [Planctomycetota bacterium]